MAFVDSDGRVIDKKSLKFYKQIYENILEGYKTAFEGSRHYALEASFYDPIMEQLKLSVDAFFAKFDETSNLENKVNIDDFYKDRMTVFCNELKSKISPDKKYFRDRPRFEATYIQPLEEIFGDNPPAKDSRAGLEFTMSSFKLPDKPFKGIEKLGNYNPDKDDMKALLTARKANSNTYEGQEDQINDEVKDAEFGFLSATEVSRYKADEFKSKNKISFGDLFEVFSDVNSLLRTGDDQGGKIRVDDVQAGEIVGIHSTSIPGHLYTMLQKVADHMNEIKETKDPLLQKSQAIQLASFAYQMSVSEHVFGDGNGRTCRILADTILQTFGMPPHTPNIALINTGATIGNPLDFDHGAKLFMEGVRVSDEIIKIEKNNTIEEMPKRAEEYLASEHMRKDILDTLSPRDAISLAVQSRENKFSFAEALDDFMSADNLLTWNSSEYKNVIKAAKAVKKCMETEPVNSAKSREAFKKFHDASDAYEKHCQEKPNNTPNRKARQKALFSMGTALYYTENTAKRETRLEAKAVLNKISNIKEDIIKEMTVGDSNKAMAKFIIARHVEKELSKNEPKITIDEAEKILKFDSKSVDAVSKDKTLMEAATEVAKTGALVGKGPKEQLDTITDKFDKLKEIQAAKLKREQAAAQKKVSGPAVSK